MRAADLAGPWDSIRTTRCSLKSRRSPWWARVFVGGTAETLVTSGSCRGEDRRETDQRPSRDAHQEAGLRLYHHPPAPPCPCPASISGGGPDRGATNGYLGGEQSMQGDGHRSPILHLSTSGGGSSEKCADPRLCVPVEMAQARLAALAGRKPTLSSSSAGRGPMG